jgi:CspA family cold shock protein
MPTGTVKWFNLERDSDSSPRTAGPDVFVHYPAIASGGYREVAEGQKVEFDVTRVQKGPQAETSDPARACLLDL